MIKHLLSISFWSLLIACSVTAQPTIYIPDMTVEPDETFTVSLIGVEISNVSSMQFGIMWNPDVIEYVGVDSADFYLPSSGSGSASFFGETSVEDGDLTLVYFHPNFGSIGLGDDEAMFDVTFKAVGPLQSLTDIVFFGIGTPPNIEIGDSLFNIIDVELVPGTINIGEPVSTRDLSPPSFDANPNFPNPFSQFTIIPISIEEAGETQLTIYDLLGQPVLTRTQYLPRGLHRIRLDSMDLPHSGTFWYEWKLHDRTQIQQMIFVQ